MKKIKKNKNRNKQRDFKQSKSVYETKTNTKKCPWCDSSPVINPKEEMAEHLIITKSDNNHFHTHAPDENEITEELLEAAISECGITKFQNTNKEKEPPKEIVFRNRQRIGDSLMFTAGIRDFKKTYPNTKVNVVSTAMHIWDNNPNVDCSVVPTEENTVKIGPGKLTNASNRLDWHFANAYRVSMENELGLAAIPQGETKVDIWLTEEEFNAPPAIEKPYWVICIGGEKGWGCKMYPFNKWQTFVEQNPDINFCQIGTNEDKHPKLQGDNIINYIGKTQSKETGIRDLFKLFLNMEGGIGLVSFGMHLASAFNKPYVVIAGAREPRSFTAYPGHQYLSTEGTSPCGVKACWHCDINTCPALQEYPEMEHEIDRKVPLCVDIIQPEDISNALRKYYAGGRLVLGKQLAKPKFKNIVKEAKIHTTPTAIVSKEAKEAKKLGIEFGGGSLTEGDWTFMKSVIDTYTPQSLLEFGAGASTTLLNKEGLDVTTYETMQGWIDKLKRENKDYNISLWNGKAIKEELPMFDMAFVDGPSGAQNREWSTKIASEHADIIIVHDAGRENERRWQFRHIKSGFNLVARGGNRCHLWVRKGMYEDVKTNFKVWSKPQQVHLDRIIDTPIAPPPIKPKPPEMRMIKELKEKPEVKAITPIVQVPIAKKEEKKVTTLVIKPEVPKLQDYKLPTIKDKKYIKFVFNGRGEGGAERSITWMIHE